MKPIERVKGITVTFEKDTPPLIANQLINDVVKVSELYKYSRVNLKICNTCPKCGGILEEERNLDARTLYHWKCPTKGCHYKY